MDISYIANLAEIFGTAAIVISLIYVAIQIRQGNQAMRMTAAQNVSRDIQNSISHIASDTEFAGIHLNGMKDLDSLSPAERHRFYAYVYHYLQTMENAFYQNEAGALDEYVWNSLTANIILTARTSGYSQFWRDRRQFFGQDFQDFYNGLSASDGAVATAPYKEPSE